MLSSTAYLARKRMGGSGGREETEETEETKGRREMRGRGKRDERSKKWGIGGKGTDEKGGLKGTL